MSDWIWGFIAGVCVGGLFGVLSAIILYGSMQRITGMREGSLVSSGLRRLKWIGIKSAELKYTVRDAKVLTGGLGAVVKDASLIKLASLVKV